MALAATAAALAVTGAMASPSPRPTAIVSIGDSFISGEGGGRYGASGGNGCDRSATAPIRSAPIAVDRKVNLACSGARTENIWRTVSRGRPHRGEPPQADQLASVASHAEVKLIVLTAGANDLGFGGLVADCALDWARSSPASPRYCHPDARREIELALPLATRGLRKAIGEVQAVMARAGYRGADYRLIVMGYASPFPAGAQIRYPEDDWSRLIEGGCPVWNADADWAKRQAIPTIAAMTRAAATAEGAEHLDLQHALEGHEVCAKGARRPATPSAPPETAEWFRRLSFTDGPIRESLHPSPVGQRAIGICLALVYAAQPGDHHVCQNTRGAYLGGMRLLSR